MAILPRNGKEYIIYLDNLFTDMKLLIYRKKRDWGIIKTYIGKLGIVKKFNKIKT